MQPFRVAALPLDKRDLGIAAAVAAFALVIYTLALAPDLLYGDSGEFQTLAYTWGTTHHTGYPVYLVLARLVSLLPLNNLAWRINFVSALCGALAAGGIFLLVRHYAGRGGAVFAALLLLVGYTFWSQSIIAEVYTPAALLIVIALLLLLHWSDAPANRRNLLFAAGLLITSGVGVHLFLALIAPAALVFVLWGAGWRHLLTLLLGMIAGAALFVLLFLAIDARPTPTNFFTSALYPSRDAWGLQETDFDTPFKRLWLSISGRQWQPAMLPADLDYQPEIALFFEEILPREYTQPGLLLALVGAIGALLFHARKFALLAGVLLVDFAAALSYTPSDKYIFFLPAYLMIAAFAGIGADRLGRLARLLPIPQLHPLAGGLVIVGLLAICAGPFLESRLEAVQTGESQFVTDRYPYPVEDLTEPRRAAECVTALVAEPDALIVMGWRVLWPLYHVTHVEQGRTGIDLREAYPYGARQMAEGLQSEVEAAMEAGRAVYTDGQFRELIAYRFAPAGNCPEMRLFRLEQRDA